MLLKKSRGQLLLAPERVKGWGRGGKVEMTVADVSGGERKV